MDTILDNYENKIKPTAVSKKCEKMLDEAFAYIAQNSLRQAQIMIEQFEGIIDILKKQPGIGTKYKNGIRKIKLGKFRYNIFYRENENDIDILGIWHTSRGTDFMEPAETELIDLGLTTDFSNY
jgi:plasmid stabilization system protein ParE